MNIRDTRSYLFLVTALSKHREKVNNTSNTLFKTSLKTLICLKDTIFVKNDHLCCHK